MVLFKIKNYITNFTMEAASEPNDPTPNFKHYSSDPFIQDFNFSSESNGLTGDFYSVFVPSDVRQKGIDVCNYVFQDKVKALKMVKNAKKARFKHFNSYTEALKFATIGIVDVAKNESASQIGNERMSPFKGPKPQDLVKLRKAIEIGDVDLVRSSVWENPRYLVSNGDTPSILQEGFRYNALHIAAKAKNGTITELILSTISNPKFVKLLYGDDLTENVHNRIQVLLDLYLNTPDKGLNETPLHFAAKFGAVDVVDVLVSFAQCDKNLKNKYGQTAAMIICDRCDNKDGALKKKIALLLENNYYVPVLRAEDMSQAPLIGEPFSPGRPPPLSSDPLSPRLEIHAYAGPMNKEGAEQFRKVWKTPPRTSTPIKRKFDGSSLESVLSLRYTDTCKGLERLGQKLATKFDVTWKEYWSFLECFVDITSEEGLAMFEHYLASRIEKNPSLTPSPDTPEEICAGKKSFSTIEDLCMHMQNCNLGNSASFDEQVDFNQFLCIEKACNVFANRLACEINNRINDSFQMQVNLLEMQVKQVELLALSYMDDIRFNKINFGALHPRLGLLTGEKLCLLIEESKRNDYIQSMNKFLCECSKAFDCFSSDDDEANIYSKNNKPTSSKKQLICLMQQISNVFTVDNTNNNGLTDINDESACREAWLKMKECNCVFHFKKTRKALGLSRNNSVKYSKAAAASTSISKKLFFDLKDEIDAKKTSVIECLSSSDEEDEFFTPPSTPPLEDYYEEEFSDALIMDEVFIEGTEPTKTDCDVYKALKLTDCTISNECYPNIYRWYHNVGLYSDLERESWPKPIREQFTNTSQQFCTPPRNQSNKSHHATHTPTSNSWLRITGLNSPRASLQKFN